MTKAIIKAFTNSVDPDETAHFEPSHQNLFEIHSLSFRYKHLFSRKFV